MFSSGGQGIRITENSPGNLSNSERRRTQNETPTTATNEAQNVGQLSADERFQSVLRAFAELSETQRQLLAQIASKPASTSNTQSH